MKKLLFIIIAYYISIPVIQACNLGQKTLQDLINPLANSQQQIWLGADIATSIKVSANRLVWMFGDTLLGTTAQRARHLQAMVHNSVGVMQCQAGHWQVMKKYVNRDQQKPQAIFQVKHKGQFLWPTAAIMLQQHLLVAAYRVRAKGLKMMGTVMIDVRNPGDVPTHWHYHLYPLLMTSSTLTYASALVRDGQWLYLMGTRGKGVESHSVFARISVLAAQHHLWWYLRRLKVATQLPAISEATILTDPKGGWQIYALPAFSREIHHYRSVAFNKPWKDLGVVHQFKSQNIQHESISYYALKAHPEFSPMLFTYNTNFLNWQSASWSQLVAVVANPHNGLFYIPQQLQLAHTL